MKPRVRWKSMVKARYKIEQVQLPAKTSAHKANAMALIHELIITPPLTFIRIFLIFSPLILLPISFIYCILNGKTTWSHALHTFAYSFTSILVFVVLILLMSLLANVTLYITFKYYYPNNPRSFKEYETTIRKVGKTIFPAGVIVVALAYAQVYPDGSVMSLLSNALQWDMASMYIIVYVAYEIWGPKYLVTESNLNGNRDGAEGKEKTAREKLAERFAKSGRQKRPRVKKNTSNVQPPAEDVQEPKNRAEKRKLAQLIMREATTRINRQFKEAH